MLSTAQYFKDRNEPFAYGFFEHEEAPRFCRYAQANRRFLEECVLPEYDGGSLYPCGRKLNASYAVLPDYSYTYSINYQKLKEKCEPEQVEKIKNEMDWLSSPAWPHWVGGWAYVHSFPHYHRVETEGLNAYRQRVEKMQDEAMRQGLLSVLEGISCYHQRSLAMLRAKNARTELIEALERVPFEPARTLYEAMVCRNFIYYMDFCDNPGRLDAELYDFYQGEDAEELFRAFFKNVDINDGWSSSIGPEYNELTVQVLRAVKGMRRPSIELRVTKDMPGDIWEAAIESIQAGGGSPSLYNEELYQQGLAERFPHISPEDRMRFNGGGCTETMLAGVSRVGSLDAGINTALVLRDTITESLKTAESFEAFYETLMSNLDTAVSQTFEKLAVTYNRRIEGVPHPMRTLLVDDCIDNEKDFNAGGARVNWSVVNFAGIINVVDSLLAIRELMFEKKVYSGEEFVSLLDAEDEAFYQQLRRCGKFGVDDEKSDALAADFTEKLFGLLDHYKPVFGEGFLPSSIQFTTYADAGRNIGPTPDGRKNGEPLCDSLSAIHGNDIKGPTALLNSVTHLKLQKALGTPVLNLSLSPQHIDKTLKPLIVSYFEKGGMQAQITCVSREEMLDALEHPEKHENLVVRVGGYSEYFNRLSEALKHSVIARTVQS